MKFRRPMRSPHHAPPLTQLLFLVPLLLAPAVAAQVHFEEVGAQRGIEPYVMAVGFGGGVAAADFDDDGDVDFFIPTAEGFADQLYRNRGEGRLEEIATAAGLAYTGRSRVALWFDYDGDHRLDLFVAADCWLAAPDCPDAPTLRLYRQVAGTQFVEVSAMAGLDADLVIDHSSHRGGISAGDIDQDGDLDLAFGLWRGRSRLLRNQGDGTFIDVTATSGLGVHASYWQAMMHDWNGDGWLDISWPVDFVANQLWINQRDGTFVDRATEAGFDSAWNDMGQTLGDYDGDGDFDVYITNINRDGRHNLLLRNDSVGNDLFFTEVSEAAGVSVSGWDWGTIFLDVDNDGDLDLASTNGWYLDDWIFDRSSLWNNEGGEPVVFTQAAAEMGFDDELWGSALVAVDYDRDGDLDFMQSCNGFGPQPHQLRLLENQPAPANRNHFLVVQPRMPGSNHRAIGAVVRIEVGARRMMRLISAGTSFLSQEPAEAFFGVGTAEAVERLTIAWPDGTTDELVDVAVDQVLRVEQSHLPELFVDGFESGDCSAWTLSSPACAARR